MSLSFSILVDRLGVQLVEERADLRLVGRGHIRLAIADWLISRCDSLAISCPNELGVVLGQKSKSTGVCVLKTANPALYLVEANDSGALLDR